MCETVYHSLYGGGSGGGSGGLLPANGEVNINYGSTNPNNPRILYEKLTEGHCSVGTSTALTGQGTKLHPWQWTCQGENGGDGEVGYAYITLTPAQIMAILTTDLDLYDYDNEIPLGQKFFWSSAGLMPGMYCVQITEAADPDSWEDNYFCSRISTGMVWSSAGPIAGMRCTKVSEGAEPSSHTWDDNYLCLPNDSNCIFYWSSAGPIAGKNCVQWLETADPHTWDDNYLCWD
jgi:hypothetical protein